MTTMSIYTDNAETSNVIRSDTGGELGSLKALASPSLQAIEDFLDIQTGLRTEALYHEHGRSAFRSYDEYRAKRLGRGV